jgi:outer membrane murein-binding lipoprotein Lpp
MQTMTYLEAKAKALADGIPESDCTPEVVADYGWVPSDPPTGMEFVPAQTPEKVKADCEALLAEAKANSLPAWMLSALQNLMGIASKAGWVAILTSVLLLGGCASQQAQNSVDQTALAVQNLHRNHVAFEDKFIAANYAANVKEAEALSAKALESVTRTETYIEKVPKTMVNGVVTEWTDVTKTRQVADPATVTALVAKRIKNLAECDKTVVSERLQQAKIGMDAANALTYLSGLKDWFTGQQATQQAWADAQAALWAALDKYLTPAEKK